MESREGGGGLKAYHPKPSKTDTLQSFYTQSATQPGADLACGFSVVLFWQPWIALLGSYPEKRHENDEMHAPLIAKDS